MPASSTRDTLARQWELLKRLPSRGPGLTVRDLGQVLSDAGFAVTKRTVERDLNELSTLFPLVCNDKGTPHGWHWMPGSGPDLPGLTLADALSLKLVEDTVRPLLPGTLLESLESRFRQARDKLTALMAHNNAARWIDKVRQVPPTLPFLPPRIEPGVQQTVQDALLTELQLDVVYHRPGQDQRVNLRLHPLGWVQRGPVSYLVATTFDYPDVRLYAVHRINQAALTNESVRRPADFDLDAYIARGALQFGASDGEPVLMEAMVSRQLASYLIETPVSTDMRLEPTGDRYRLLATVPDSWALTWWLLSQGASIEVIAPLQLRDRLITDLDDARNVYRISGGASRQAITGEAAP